MKKQNVYVPIANKKEAKRAKAVLEALDVPIANGVFFDVNREDYPCVLGFDRTHLDVLLCHYHHRIASRTKITLKQLIELLVSEQKDPEKIAVRVDNEKEFNALMKYYDSLGWKWESGLSPLEYECKIYFPSLVIYEDNFLSMNRVYAQYEGYKIIPFSDFAKEHDIRVPLLVSEDGVELFEGDRAVTVVVSDLRIGNSDWYVHNKFEPEERDDNYKYFSTKKAALDWIEAQNRKEVIISPNSTYPLIVTKNKASIDVSKKPTPDGNIDINKDELYQALKAMEELNS